MISDFVETDGSEWPEKWLQDAFLQKALSTVDNPTSLKQGAITALSAGDLNQKVAATRYTAIKWFSGSLGIGGNLTTKTPDRPGRPTYPILFLPVSLKTLHPVRKGAFCASPRHRPYRTQRD